MYMYLSISSWAVLEVFVINYNVVVGVAVLVELNPVIGHKSIQ